MSPKARKEVLDFDGTDPEPLLRALGDLSHQEGWMNLTPGVPSDAIVEESSLFSWLSGARPQAAPMATWMPPATGSPKPGVLGVLHARGRLHPDGVAKLKSIPVSWSCRQDHARRGGRQTRQARAVGAQRRGAQGDRLSRAGGLRRFGPVVVRGRERPDGQIHPRHLSVR